MGRIFGFTLLHILTGCCSAMCTTESLALHMHDEKDNASSTETSNLLLMICKIFLARAIVLARTIVLVSPNVMNCPVCYRLCCLMICTEAAESLALTDRTNNAAPAVITRTNKQYCMSVKKCNVMQVASNCVYINKNDKHEKNRPHLQ